MAQRVAGTLYIVLDAQQFEVDMANVEYPLTDTKNEAVMSTTGVAGRKETPITPHIKFTAILTPDFPYGALRALENGNITASLANGVTYHLGGCHLENGPTGDGFEGNTEQVRIGGCAEVELACLEVDHVPAGDRLGVLLDDPFDGGRGSPEAVPELESGHLVAPLRVGLGVVLPRLP